VWLLLGFGLQLRLMLVLKALRLGLGLGLRLGLGLMLVLIGLELGWGRKIVPVMYICLSLTENNIKQAVLFRTTSSMQH